MNKRKILAVPAVCFRAVIGMAAILGAVATAIGFSMYTLAMNGQYINTAHHVSTAAAAIITASVDPTPYTDMVARTYRSLTEEERLDQTSAAYRNHFRAIENDKGYQQIMKILPFLQHQDRANAYQRIGIHHGAILFLAERINAFIEFRTFFQPLHG